MHSWSCAGATGLRGLLLAIFQPQKLIKPISNGFRNAIEIVPVDKAGVGENRFGFAIMDAVRSEGSRLNPIPFVNFDPLLEALVLSELTGEDKVIEGRQDVRAMGCDYPVKGEDWVICEPGKELYCDR
jgi:hypothetical protein